MSVTEVLRPSDAGVVARYLQLRSLFHDLHLARLEKLVPERYEVQLSRRIAPTLVAQVRTGFTSPGEGEIWPVVFLTAVDISVALCVQITPERLANMGTLLNGPQRLRHRHWEDWFGWEKSLGEVHPLFFEQNPTEQAETLTNWFLEGLEWLTHAKLLRRTARSS
jgi:hypothetical protein